MVWMYNKGDKKCSSLLDVDEVVFAAQEESTGVVYLRFRDGSELTYTVGEPAEAREFLDAILVRKGGYSFPEVSSFPEPTPGSDPTWGDNVLEWMVAGPGCAVVLGLGTLSLVAGLLLHWWSR